jgi:hypothetical protein
VASLDEVTESGYLDGLEHWSLDDVRSRRDESNEIETGLSYLRRIVQGRLDIVLAAQARRRRGDDAMDATDLVEELPAILGEHVHAPGLGRLPTLIGPGELNAEFEARLEAILPASQLSGLDGAEESELSGYAQRLEDLEKGISVERRAVLDVIDRLQEEIVRRYRSGEATVDNLLP